MKPRTLQQHSNPQYKITSACKPNALSNGPQSLLESLAIGIEYMEKYPLIIIKTNIIMKKTQIRHL